MYVPNISFFNKISSGKILKILRINTYRIIILFNIEEKHFDKQFPPPKKKILTVCNYKISIGKISNRN